MRKALVLGSVAAMAFGLALAAPAGAATGDTVVTFTVGSTVPSVAVVGGVWTPGTGTSTTAVGTIVGTVITDTRIPAVTTTGNWTDVVSASSFDMVGVTTPAVADGTRIAPSSATIWSDDPVVTIPGTATVTNDHPSSTPLTLASTTATLLHASTKNPNISTFTSHVSINTSAAATGAFLGTITQTVS
ncbi:MAG: hypothetical protein JWO12_3184 [Frankiales bacterium]|nr:hypothetical protein [Frankiales bacterium]